jgi:CheY-like chemotaxis protein
MEDGTGVGLRQRIRSLNLREDPYFILLTGHPTDSNAREAAQSGIDLYLTKPFQLPALALAVDAGLKRKPEPTANPALRASEAFYHDLFLNLNPVLPRMLMLLEGRYTPLNATQIESLTALFDSWRHLSWTMGEFYHRVGEGASPRSERQRWSGPRALKRILTKLEPDLKQARLDLRVLREARLPMAEVHIPTAEGVLEAILLRLAAFTAPNSLLMLAWSEQQGRLQLALQGERRHPQLDADLMSHLRILPPAPPLLDEAGVRLDVREDLGPWTLTFDPAR